MSDDVDEMDEIVALAERRRVEDAMSLMERPQATTEQMRMVLLESVDSRPD